MPPTNRIDWDANNGALALRLVEEIRNDEAIRRVLWRRKNESHCDIRDQEATAMVVAKALFPLETDVVQLAFHAMAVTKRVRNVRCHFNGVKKLVQNGRDINWKMETVEGLPVQKKWAEVLRRCPHFRTYAFFNGAISESEIRGSALDVDPLTPSTKPLPPQDGPNALNENPAPHSHRRNAAEPGEEIDETVGEYRDSDSEENDGEEDDKEPDEEKINQGTGNEEEEVIILAADRAQLREGLARLTNTCSITPTARNNPDLQLGKRHREASPPAVAREDVELRREQMRFNHELKKERLKQKELDKERRHERRMIKWRIKLAKIEKEGVNKE